MDKKDVKFNDVIVIGRMNNMGASKSLYCVIMYCDISKLKVETGDSLPVRYVSSFYDYKIGDSLLLVEDGERVSLYYKKGGKKVSVK